MAENDKDACSPQSFSIPQYQTDWLERKKRENPRIKISTYVQEGLDMVIRKEKNTIYSELSFILLIMTIGVTLCIFSILFIPSDLLPLFVGIGLLSIIAGYVGLYLFFKKRRPKTWTS